MDASVPFENSGKCCNDMVSSSNILYQILNCEEQQKTRMVHQHFLLPPLLPKIHCPCEVNRRVILKTPNITCTRASEVLLKTIMFIRNLPSFFQLPPEDQLLLMTHSWVPLFILGLAQDQVDFELEELSTPSLLKMILLNQYVTDHVKLESSPLGFSFVEVQKIKNFLGKVWKADISAREYAYLKGIVLFHPDVRDLKYRHYVQTLQQEAQHALMECISMIYSRSLRRYTWIMELLGFLRSFHTDTVRELFFTPLLGNISLSSFLLDILYSKQ
ncbi:nuclear receptor subfamily 0 group B member 2 [Pogona vitticeps]